jgi:DNA (cytosine-5)-methyltransferase 1
MMLNIVEFFSGIGSQAKALKNLGLEINTLGTSEWDVHAIVAYDLIHNQASMDIPEDIQKMTKEEILEILKKYTFSNSGKKELDYSSFKTYSEEALKRIFCSVRRNCNFVDISEVKGAEMPDGIDILTYSFPCQDLSNVGAFHGYNRGIDKDSSFVASGKNSYRNEGQQ